MKKGAAHFETIIAFVLFVTFLLFLFIYVRPSDESIISDYSLQSLNDNFAKKAEVELITVFLKKETPGCISVDFNLNNLTSISKSISGAVIPSSFSDGTLIAYTDEDAFRIYFAEGLLENPAQCSPPVTLSPENYTLGSFEKSYALSDSKLQEIKLKYQSDYKGLKEDFGISSGFDFAIVSEGFVLEKPIPEEAEINARTYNHQVLYPNGDIINKEFTFKIW